MAQEAELWRMFDLDTLQEIQDRFSETTGLGAIMADRTGQALTQASCFSKLCQRIRSTPEGRRRCFASDAEVGLEAVRTGHPCIHYCHAGLLDAAAPIVVNGTYVGSVLCGQVLLEPPDAGKRHAVARKLADLGITPQEVDECLAGVTIITPERFKAATGLLQVLANYVVNQVATYEAERRLAEESRARVELEKSLKEMELRVLQSQVNPHFLFNALNTVARMALFEEAHQTQDLVLRMTRILRCSLSRVDQLIPLRDELAHVEDYLYIQRVRFGDRIVSRFEIDAEVLDTLIPIFTVQPLVENAVVRGLEPLPGGGEVAIRAWAEEPDVVIEVYDTGVGLDVERGNQLRWQTHSHSTEGHTTGLGIPNVHQRLRHYFGEKYGLVFLDVTRGTRVQVRVPRHGTAGGVQLGAQSADRR